MYSVAHSAMVRVARCVAHSTMHVASCASYCALHLSGHSRVLVRAPFRLKAQLAPVKHQRGSHMVLRSRSYRIMHTRTHMPRGTQGYVIKGRSGAVCSCAHIGTQLASQSSASSSSANDSSRCTAPHCSTNGVPHSGAYLPTVESTHLTARSTNAPRCRPAFGCLEEWPAPVRWFEDCPVGPVHTVMLRTLRFAPSHFAYVGIDPPNLTVEVRNCRKRLHACCPCCVSHAASHLFA